MEDIVLKIKAYLKINKDAYEMFSLLEKSCDMYIMGGILRDLYLHNNIIDAKDIDIIIRIKDRNAFNKIIKKYNPKINAFGGFKLKIDNITFDIWEIQSTWAYKSGTVVVKEVEMVANLQNTVFLNIDSIVYDIQTDKLYLSRFKECIDTGILDIVLEENPHIDLNILRSMVLRHKYSLTYSNRLKDLIHKEYKLKSFLFIERLLEIQQGRYEHEILNREQIEHEVENILNV